ncbi:MAG TPA: hypothetical protein VMU26_16095 [Candidatus Polarisedimenticolia bacterium]|nr:hypothetical protein [Candidatus Polarisedimenticolia bacterium]
MRVALITPVKLVDMFSEVSQKRKNSRRLLLNTGQHAVVTQLKRLLVELKISESNDRHGGERRATEASAISGDVGRVSSRLLRRIASQIFAVSRI